jgi:hypothetical protein
MGPSEETVAVTEAQNAPPQPKTPENAKLEADLGEAVSKNLTELGFPEGTPENPIDIDAEARKLSPQDVATMKATAAAHGSAAIAPKPIQATPSSLMAFGERPPQPKVGPVVVTDNGKPLFTVTKDQLEQHKRFNAMSVAQVFQPLVDGADSDEDKADAIRAQHEAANAAYSGMSRDKAIELGTHRYDTQRMENFRRNWDKFPPGGKKGTGGGGGLIGGLSPKLAGQLREYTDKVIDDVSRDFGIPKSSTAITTANTIQAQINDPSGYVQASAFAQQLHELFGAAQTASEKATLFQGIPIESKIQMWENRLVGGQIPDDVRQDITQTMELVKRNLLQRRSEGALAAYDRIVSNPLAGDEKTRQTQAWLARHYFSGEAIPGTEQETRPAKEQSAPQAKKKTLRDNLKKNDADKKAEKFF